MRALLGCDQIIFAVVLAAFQFFASQSVAEELSAQEVETYHAAFEAYTNGEYESAFKKFLSLSETGDRNVQYALGWMYQYGLGVEVDLNKALYWLHLAAEQGNARAQYNIGYMYHYGWGGVDQDLSEATKWYALAADQGNEFAQYEIGSMKFNGQGTDKDIEGALRLFESAAAKKFNRALDRLGSIYFEGSEVEKDFVLAYMWWSIAIATEETAPNGQSEFLDKMSASVDKVSAMMSSADIAKAKELAAAKLSSFN